MNYFRRDCGRLFAQQVSRNMPSRCKTETSAGLYVLIYQIAVKLRQKRVPLLRVASEMKTIGPDRREAQGNVFVSRIDHSNG